MSKSDALETLYINHEFRTATFAKPSSCWIGLFTAAPSDAGGGTEVSTAGTNYARVDAGVGDSSWAATSGGSGLTSNLAAITFPDPLGNNWGTVTHFAIFDSPVGGTMRRWSPLVAPKLITAGDLAPVFPIGGLTVTEG
jgi:hypothetical protein